MMSINFSGHGNAVIGRFRTLDVVVMTARTFDVKGLGHCRKAKKLILFQILADKLGLVPIEAVLTVSSLTPTTTQVLKSASRFLGQIKRKR